MKNNSQDYNDFIESFRTIVKKNGLKNSTQREYILKILFESTEHLSAEQIANEIKIKYGLNIGIATVYRVISFLEEINIISSLLLDTTDTKIYELNISAHHDHLVCQKCKKVIEFYDGELEQIQEYIATKNNFKLLKHNMILYGLCEACQN